MNITIWTITTRAEGSGTILYGIGDGVIAFTKKEYADACYNSILEQWKGVEHIEDHVTMQEVDLFDEQRYIQWNFRDE